MISLLKFDKIPSTHPQIIDVPTLENISEIFSKKQAFESTLLVNYIDPQATMNIGHCLKGFP